MLEILKQQYVPFDPSCRLKIKHKKEHTFETVKNSDGTGGSMDVTRPGGRNATYTGFTPDAEVL